MHRANSMTSGTARTNGGRRLRLVEAHHRPWEQRLRATEPCTFGSAAPDVRRRLDAQQGAFNLIADAHLFHSFRKAHRISSVGDLRPCSRSTGSRELA
jgi:hypothetical protein